VTRRGWLLFLAMCLLWGIPYLLIKVAVWDLSPPTLVFGRTAVGAAVLLPVAAARGQLRAALAHWRPLVAFTILEMAGPWLLLADAERTLTSSLTGLLIAAVPMVAAVASRVIGDDDRLDRMRPSGSPSASRASRRCSGSTSAATCSLRWRSGSLSSATARRR